MIKQLLAIVLLATVAGATTPSRFGIYGTTFRVSGGVHSDGNGALMQCYTYADVKGALDYMSCFDWNGGEFEAGPGCVIDANNAVTCDLDGRKITGLDIRFADNPGSDNTLEWTGVPAPDVTKITVEGSRGVDEVGAFGGAYLQQIFPNFLMYSMKKRNGHWHVGW